MISIRAGLVKKLVLIVVPCLLAALLAASGPAGRRQASAATGSLMICSTNSTGEAANGSCSDSVMTPDCRYLVFKSLATNFVEGATSTYTQIYRKDMTTGGVVCCSITAAGVFGNYDSSKPAITPDGRYVSFSSKANNFMGGDSGSSFDVFRKDLMTGDLVCCSTSASSVKGNKDSYGSRMNVNGKYVVFTSASTNLTESHTNSCDDVFRKDMDTGEIMCCSTNSSSVLGSSSSFGASLNSTGDLVYFCSSASNLMPGEETYYVEGYRKNLNDGSVAYVSTDSDGSVLRSHYEDVTLSSNDRYLIFRVSADGFFLKDLTTNAFRECVYDYSGRYSYDRYEGTAAISGDGRYVAFSAYGYSLTSHVFRKDLVSGRVVCCSASNDNVIGYGASPSISSDGRYVYFCSGSSLVNPAPVCQQVYMKEPLVESPHMSSIDESTGWYGGSLMKIYGNFFGESRGSSYVSFGSQVATDYSSWSDSEIDLIVPTNLYDTTSVTVTNSFGVSNSIERVISPHITSVDPDHAGIGSLITIYGSGFWDVQGNSSVWLSGANGNDELYDVVSWSNNAVSFRLPYNRYRGREIDVGLSVRGTMPQGKQIDFDVVGMGFAEGYTGSGFQEYLCIGNPTQYPADVTIYYLLPDNYYWDQDITVPPNSRTTVNVNAEVPDLEVSAYIESDVEVVVERPMYFNYGGAWTGGHNTVASRYVSKNWFFAEGYTGPGFDEWVCVLNMGSSDANLTFHFQTQEEGEVIRNAIVPKAARGSFKINDLLGPNYQCSLWLESDQFVVAERSMYFDYMGAAAGHWEGGHCVMGVPYLSKEYYFAEGTTRAGFEEWLTIQNPHDHEISVSAVYQMQAGQGDPVTKTYKVGPGQRATAFVPGEIGMEKDVSIKLASDYDFLAERPMYFRYMDTWEGGHCVIGAMQPSSDWFFAEGYTGEGFHEWLCLQNPGTKESTVEVTYLVQGSGPLAPRTVKVGAGSRVTIAVNFDAGTGLSLSTKLRVTSGPDIVAERPMYFDFNGWDGGHDVVGYVPSMILSASFNSAGSRDIQQIDDFSEIYLKKPTMIKETALRAP